MEKFGPRKSRNCYSQPLIEFGRNHLSSGVKPSHTGKWIVVCLTVDCQSEFWVDVVVGLVVTMEMYSHFCLYWTICGVYTFMYMNMWSISIYIDDLMDILYVIYCCMPKVHVRTSSAAAEIMVVADMNGVLSNRNAFIGSSSCQPNLIFHPATLVCQDFMMNIHQDPLSEKDVYSATLWGAKLYIIATQATLAHLTIRR